MKIYAAYKTLFVKDKYGSIEIDKYYDFFETELDCLRYCVNSALDLKCKEIVLFPNSENTELWYDAYIQDIIIPATSLSDKASTTIKSKIIYKVIKWNISYIRK